MKKKTVYVPRWRQRFVAGLLVLSALSLCWRAIDIQVVNNERYQDKGDAAHLRVVPVPAHRGMISDRNGDPLAISTPVESVWVNPGEVMRSEDKLPALATALSVDVGWLRKRLKERGDREFVYIKRRVTPAVSQRVRQLAIAGVNLQREFRRYYPGGEVAAHVVGFTDVDDIGQEGLELAYDNWLRGEPGSKRVLQDRRGQIIANVERLENVKEGNDLQVSIDRRIQYLAYRSLKASVQGHNARAGSLVILDARTGEVLAMVNQPAFNPNSRAKLRASSQRNRTVTDVFEPGSTLKPFIIAAALESGAFSPKSVIDTAPGTYYVGRNTVKDIRNYGPLDLTAILQKSSNVGISKVALTLDRELVWQSLANLGFGSVTGSTFPGEHGGMVNDYHQWSKFDHATIAFGYGIASTTLQLARAYSVLADNGRLKPVSLQRINEVPRGERVMSEQVARQVRVMLESVVSEKGTAPAARIPGYTVAGKTGTVHKHEAGRYVEDKYLALFAGMVPAKEPRLVGVVLVDEPAKGEYYGGVVAAPVFAEVMAGALRLLDIKPDALDARPTRIAAAVHKERGAL